MNTVELSGHYGGDETHALSAWTSTHRDLSPDRLERMDKLLKFLAENKHHTPFEKSFLHFLVTCDTASHIHILKHRVGVSVNGESARYKEHQGDKYYLPDDWNEEWRTILDDHCRDSYYLYHEALRELESIVGRKRAKESARFFLPYSSQLTLDVAFNFRSLMHFQGLRRKPDAQDEIYDIADQMLKLVAETGDFDLSLRAFGYEPTEL